MSLSQNNHPIFSTIDEALEDLRQGKLIIVVDDEDRENEGDFICAADRVTPEIINFMATHGRGLVCVALTEERCRELDLPLMVQTNTALNETAFTVSVDLNGNGCTTGISAGDRARTIQALINPSTKPEDLGRPGHIFPLKARNNGVLRRAGHTEAVIDLTRIAGLSPAGVLVEIMNEDGTMARLPQLIEVATRFNCRIISIADLITYRRKVESLIVRGDEVGLPTEHGDFRLIPFMQKSNGLEHIAIFKGQWKSNEPILVRVHSSCATGDIFGSRRCDCGEQLHQAMALIEEEGRGVVVYMNQEGRGIGLFNKIKAYKLQEQGLDTVQANLHLGFKADERDYGVGANILRDLGVGKIRLMTNNPRKLAGIQGHGLEIVEHVPLVISPNKHNQRYLKTKQEKMGHLYNILDASNSRH